ncbi:hypothetical protein [Planomonospora parontospora]|uniref:hypothetical protein n=1 Tax=Planomonospora parontospora TaxID=58119 RepID=UPI00166FA36D|nr:hypothetical protein [Planomonospora parontospora]GGL59697.1 hypothetical protein GCM10014719_71270 [Planomonospora parontospora subsp. antibiotica]GII20335.1 hypothetical protein Ppa05_70610 [Planomonospora parontospora subsp. antibiotica]
MQQTQTITNLRALNGRAYDWAVAAGSAWLLAGLGLDAWAHHHFTSTLESPFTPWHAVLYSGFVALAAVLAWPWVRTRTMASIPDGYRPSVAGMALFALAAPADIVWHLLFGIEVSVEELMSPTHLLLFLGGLLMASGPLRAAWCRAGEDTAPLTALLSLAFVTVVLQILAVEYANVFALPWPVGEFDIPAPDPATGIGVEDTASLPPEIGQVIGTAGILLQAAVFAGPILFALRRWRLPYGAVTLLFIVLTAFGALIHDQPRFIAPAVLAGLVTDTLIAITRPSAESPAALRTIAFAAPAVLYTGYFTTLALTDRLAWPVEVWSGSILLAGGVGLLSSYLLLPWRTPEPRHG